MPTSSQSKTPTRIMAVLWDVDGTLIDSESLHHGILTELCADRGLSVPPESQQRLLGATMDDKWLLIEELGGMDISREEWRREFNLRYRKRVRHGLGRPEPLQAVRTLNNLGVPQVCVSNGDPEVVKANLEVLGLADAFRFHVTSSDCRRGKPDPEPYALACQRLALEPCFCLAVEDSPTGIRSALAAGLFTVAWPLAAPEKAIIQMAHHTITRGDFPWHLLAWAERVPGHGSGFRPTA